MKTLASKLEQAFARNSGMTTAKDLPLLKQEPPSVVDIIEHLDQDDDQDDRARLHLVQLQQLGEQVLGRVRRRRRGDIGVVGVARFALEGVNDAPVTCQGWVGFRCRIVRSTAS